MGNGGSGPESGPATGSRGPSGRIFLLEVVVTAVMGDKWFSRE